MYVIFILGKVKPPILGMCHRHNVSLVGTMEDTRRSQTISTESQEIAKHVCWAAKLCAKRGVACLVSHWPPVYGYRGTG